MGSLHDQRTFSKCTTELSKCLKWLAHCQGAVCAREPMRNGWRACNWYYLDRLPHQRGTDPHPLPVENFLVCWRKCVWIFIQWNCLSPGVSSNTLCHKSYNTHIHYSVCYVSNGLSRFLSLEFLYQCNRDVEMERGSLVNGDRMSEWRRVWLSEHVAAGRTLTRG